jgi:hypothetical protein
MKEITEEDDVIFNSYEQLSYQDFGGEEIVLMVDDVLIGECEVWTDEENENREYILINYEMIYLDTITKI